MLVVLEGISIALMVILIFSIVVFVVSLPAADDLPHSAVVLVFRILPIVMLVSLLFGVPLIKYTQNPEIQFRNCVETVQDRDYCEIKYLKLNSECQ